MTRVIVAMLKGYKRWLSPLVLPSCRFEPTCSEYAAAAFARHGFMAGSMLTVWRLLRCQPLARGGSDPVPEIFFQQHSHSCKR